MIEKTFIIIKPEVLQNKKECDKILGNVIKIILENGLLINKLKMTTATRNLVVSHYNHIVDKPFFKDILEHMTSGPIIIGILEGENAVKKWRELMGPTNPKDDFTGKTIRGRYGYNIGDKMFNVVHGSDSLINAKKEIKLWFGV